MDNTTLVTLSELSGLLGVSEEMISANTGEDKILQTDIDGNYPLFDSVQQVIRELILARGT